MRLGLLLSEIGRVNGIVVTPDELSAAMRVEAARYPGPGTAGDRVLPQEPAGAIEQLRGPIFEDKVVDHILSWRRSTDKMVSPEELTRRRRTARRLRSTGAGASAPAAEESRGGTSGGEPRSGPQRTPSRPDWTAACRLRRWKWRAAI